MKTIQEYSFVKKLFIATAFKIFLVINVYADEIPKNTEFDQKHSQILKSHCLKCHDERNQKGKFRVDNLSFKITDIETAERWQKVLNAVNSGEMPPENQKPLPSAAKTDFLDDLSKVMVLARKNLSDQKGFITMRRLNRREYKNTLRELLGVEINVSELPPDSGNGGFDTAGQNLFMSANQFEQYQSLGREAIEESFLWQKAAGEERKLRYEAEESLKSIQKKYLDTLDDLERAKRWAKAVEEAANLPANLEVVKKLRQEAKNEPTFRRSWALIKGAPSPEDFGFRTVENNADKANGALNYETKQGSGYMRPYHENYLRQKHLDTGAYLTIMAGEFGNDHISLYVPPSWPVGNYMVRVRIGALVNSPPERRFIEFGIHPRNGQVMSTHEVTGSINQPQVIEIPLKLTKEHSSRDNRTIFIREKGSNDHYLQTRQIFNSAKAKNGIGPELALWVDWMEIERISETGISMTPKPPKFQIGDNRQLGSISAPGLSNVRYECEAANEKVSKYVASQIKDRLQAQNWVKAVEFAASKPENKAVVEEIRKNSKNEAIFRRSWDKISGAPSPESFGFQTTENNADKANSALGENWQKYHEYYMKQPGLDRGAYLGTPTMHPAVMALGFLQMPVPNEWKSGDYLFRVRIAAAQNARPEQRFLEVGFHPRNGMVRATFEVTGTLENPQILEMPFKLTTSQTDSGDRTLFIREKGTWDNNEEGGRKRAEAVKRNGIGPEAVLWVDYMEIVRVNDSVKPMPPGLEAIGINFEDPAKMPSPEEVNAALSRFAKVAFRGSEPSESYLKRLSGIYSNHLKSGLKPAAAFKETLAIILSSPMFLYLAEPSPDNKTRSLSGPELATRLSYFLWSSPPDQQLLKLGKSGDLTKPEVLAEQTNRLLDDPRAEGFVRGFVFQWLGMDRLDFFEVNRAKYPRFDDSTRLAAKNEVYETFRYILKNNEPVTDLLKADYVVINHLLGDYYGIPGVKGDTYQKVPLPAGSPRGGLLGMAAIHVMGGNGERTSPVERGAWVLRKLLNDPPPPAPANVPQITRLAGKVLTTRERLLAHQDSPQCASCHRKIDPIGFGLENFDAVGQWRTEDSYQVLDENGKPVKGASKTWSIDPAASLYKGPSFQNYFELREILASKGDDFSRGFSSVLIEYALGRPVGFRDDELIHEMLNTSKSHRYGMRNFILALVASKEFHTK
ncbi:MAG: DUF1592 domain-containing protein [Planctomycetia bacterium]